VTDAVVIYADGACRGNPGPGGWGALLAVGERVIRALEALKRRVRADIYTDSQYVRLGILEWMPQWKARNWRTADRKPVKNQDLWMRLDELAAGHDLEWHWVKGHSGVPGNERVDALANRAIDELLA
jgi:ribonuclease HI